MDNETRLRAEAEFQNRRSSDSAQSAGESRSRFYFLANRARATYHARINQLIAGRRVLVVGCADGGVNPIVRRGARYVIGIDIAEVPIARLQDAISREGLQDRAELIVGDAQDPDLPSGSIDLICCTGVLHHLDVEKSMDSWSRLLAEGGKVVMLEPMAMNPIIALFRLLTPSMRTAYEHPLLPKDVSTMRKRFKEVKVQGFVLTSLFLVALTFVPQAKSIQPKLLKIAEAFDDRLTQTFRFLVYFCWTAVIELEGPNRR